jgi:hypothetical protein
VVGGVIVLAIAGHLLSYEVWRLLDLQRPGSRGLRHIEVDRALPHRELRRSARVLDRVLEVFPFKYPLSDDDSRGRSMRVAQRCAESIGSPSGQVIRSERIDNAGSDIC